MKTKYSHHIPYDSTHSWGNRCTLVSQTFMRKLSLRIMFPHFLLEFLMYLQVLETQFSLKASPQCLVVWFASLYPYSNYFSLHSWKIFLKGYKLKDTYPKKNIQEICWSYYIHISQNSWCYKLVITFTNLKILYIRLGLLNLFLFLFSYVLFQLYSIKCAQYF